MSLAQASDEASHPLGVLAATVAVSAWGLAGVVAKNIDMGGVAIAAYRFTIYGLVVGVVMSLRGNLPGLRVMRASMWGGLALAADAALFFSAIKLTTIANATVIGALQPVVVAAVAARWFGERVSARDVGLAVVAFAGVAVVVFAADSSSDQSYTGDLLAAGALLAWSGYFIFSKRAKNVISPSQYTLGAAIWCGVLNYPIALLFGQSLAWPSFDSWISLLVLAFGAGALGHALMNWSIQQIPLWLGSTLTLLIPVVSAGAAWVFLDESLSAPQLWAMLVVLGALAGIVSSQSGIGARPRPLRR